MAFVLLVVPGITFELLRQTRRPAFQQSALEEAARVVVASIALASAAALLLAVVSMWFTDLVLEVSTLSRLGPGWYWREHPGLVISSVALEVGAATALAALVHRSLNRADGHGSATRMALGLERFLRHQPGRQVERFPVWRTLFRTLPPPSTRTQLTVLKKDGRLITGMLAAYDSGDPGEERDLALRQPITILPKGGDAPIKVSTDWPFIVVPAGEISEIYVAWVEEPPAE